MKAIRGMFSVVLCVLLGGAGMFCYLQFVQPNFAFVAGRTAIDLEVLRESMERNNELSTAEYLYTASIATNDHNVLDLSDAGLGKVDLPLTDSTYILKFDGTIKAGFDLNESVVTQEGDTIVITLTEPTILSHVTSDITVVWEMQSICNPLHAGEESNWIVGQKEQMEERAIEQGLYDKAREYARVTFVSLFEEALPEGLHLEVRFK